MPTVVTNAAQRDFERDNFAVEELVITEEKVGLALESVETAGVVEVEHPSSQEYDLHTRYHDPPACE
jgi:hypothetical protein